MGKIDAEPETKTIYVDIDKSVTEPTPEEPPVPTPESLTTKKLISQHRVAAWFGFAFVLVFGFVWTWGVFWASGSMITWLAIIAGSIGLAVSARTTVTGFIDVSDYKAVYRRETAVDIFANEK